MTTSPPEPTDARLTAALHAAARAGRHPDDLRLGWCAADAGSPARTPRQVAVLRAVAAESDAGQRLVTASCVAAAAGSTDATATALASVRAAADPASTLVRVHPGDTVMWTYYARVGQVDDRLTDSQTADLRDMLGDPDRDVLPAPPGGLETWWLLGSWLRATWQDVRGRGADPSTLTVPTDRLVELATRLVV